MNEIKSFHNSLYSSLKKDYLSNVNSNRVLPEFDINGLMLPMSTMQIIAQMGGLIMVQKLFLKQPESVANIVNMIFMDNRERKTLIELYTKGKLDEE